MEEKKKLSKALDLAYFYLKFRPRTKKEVEEYLYKKSRKYKLNSEIINQALTVLEEQKYIDDREFIEWFVNQRLKTKPSGVILLKRELYRFKADKDAIDSFFRDNSFDEDKLALQALERRRNYFSHFEGEELKKKAISFLQRRGFSYSTAKTALQIFSSK